MLQHLLTAAATVRSPPAARRLLPACLQQRQYAPDSAGIVPDEEVGPGGGGLSQQKAKEMKALLDPYDPRGKASVSIVHKHGLALLNDAWYNKGLSTYQGLQA